MSLKIETLQVGPLPTNCYIVTSAGCTMLVDPGDRPQVIIEALGDRRPSMIVLTHAHWDHLRAVPDLVEAYGTPVLVGRLDADEASDPARNGAFGRPGRFIPIERRLDDGDTFELGDATFLVMHTPGHTPGGICLYDAADKVLFSGDTIFAGTVGRTDFEGGDPNAMMRSARRVAQLPGDVRVYPGHEESTTIGREHRVNPYMRV